MPTPATLLLLLLLAGVALWIARRMVRAQSTRRADDGDVDRDVLAAAEEEVRDLDAFTTPEDADDELPDWGPGTPRT
jgi:hypothetical protein